MPQTGLSRRKRRDQVPGFSPLNLFAASEVGLWYDPSDLTPEKLAWVAANPGFTSAQFLAAFPTHTLYQNAAGTTPVTALGQPVGLVIDKSKGGLAALGPELVTNGDFSNGTTGWSLGANWNVTNGALKHTSGSVEFTQQTRATLPLGANKLFVASITVSGITTGNFSWYLGGANSGVVNSNGVFTRYFVDSGTGYSLLFDPSSTFDGTIDNVSIREVPGVHARQATDAARPTLQARANLLTGTTTLATQTLAVLAAQHTLSFTGTGTVTLSGTSTAGPLVGTGVGQRVSLTFTPTAGNLTLTVSGTVTDAQLERSAAFTVYQRVTTATDYADVGLPRALTFDGTDDSLVTPSVNFTATDKMTVCAGVFKQSDAAAGHIAGGDGNSSGRWELLSGGWQTLGARYGFGLYGSTQVSVLQSQTGASYAAPIANVVSTLADLSLASASAVAWRINGASVNAENNTSTPSGVFGTFAIQLGVRPGGTTLPFNGRIHQLIVRGAATDTATIQQTERFVAQKTGVTL